ncbi:MAG TPA: response regulator transcription factor [Ruminococcus sp.]|nr:response regulator transcription factor [Ruminococcus sp.]
MAKKILIIEDDQDINDMLRLLLTQNGYETVSAYSGTEGLLVHGKDIDLILLDIMLPGKNGDEIIKSLKEKNPVPVIVTSAVHDVRKKVDMFALGADDYITKPFHNEELLARISVRLRNNTSQGGESKLTYKDITIDKDDYSVICHGKQCDLSRLEFDLLAILMENIGRTCTKTSIYDRVWDYETSADDNALNVHISKLRKKLKECNPDEDYIETVWSIGYRLKK